MAMHAGALIGSGTVVRQAPAWAQRRPARAASLAAGAAPRRRAPPGGGASGGSGPDRPLRRPGGEPRRRRPKPERVDRPLPGGELPSGQEEMRAAAELMAALGPAERAQLADRMRGTVYEQLIDAAAEAAAEADAEAEEEGGAYGDPSNWDEEAMSNAMWAALRNKLEPEEAAAVDAFFGPDWSNMPDLDPAAFEARVATLTDTERLALLGAIEKVDALQETVASVDALAGATQAELAEWQRRQAAEAAVRKSEGAADAAASRAARGAAAEPYPGASPAMAAAIEVLQGGETIMVDPREEEAARVATERERAARDKQAVAEAEDRARLRFAAAAATEAERREGGGASGSAARAWGDWGPRGGAGKQQRGGGDDMDSRVDSMMRHMRAMEQGVQTWGPPPSRQFQVLKDVFLRLCDLNGMDEATLEAREMKADDYAAAVDYLSEQLGALVEEVDSITDVATRSTLLWMDAAMTDPETGALAVTPQSLAEFGQFLGAAENAAALARWARAFAESHPDMPVADMLESSGLGSEDWFIRRDARLAAAAAAEAAASSGAPGSAVLSRFVDADRIEWLGALDGDTMRFMAEAEEQGHSQDVLIKWSLHPVIGPRLVSGDWYREEQLPEMLQVLLREATAKVEGVDYDMRFPKRSAAAPGRGGG